MSVYRLSAVSIARWDFEYVVYHHLSGDTHFVSGEFFSLFDVCKNCELITPTELMNQCQELGLEKSELALLVNRFVEQLSDLNILETV